MIKIKIKKDNYKKGRNTFQKQIDQLKQNSQVLPITKQRYQTERKQHNWHGETTIWALG